MPITIPDRKPCPYCENFAGRYASHGPPAVIYENDVISVFLSPASLGGMEGHTLVTTKRHVETIFDLDEKEETAVGQAVPRVARMLRNALDMDGLFIQQHNGTVAFQTVPHVHWHVVPTREGFVWPPRDQVPITPWRDRARQAERLRIFWDHVDQPGPGGGISERRPPR